VQEGGFVDIQFNIGGDDMHKEVASLAKMVGFEFLCVSTTDTGIKVNGKKPKFVAKADGPAKIKRKPKAAPVEDAAANPWANLEEQPAGQINEDALMTQEANGKPIAAKLCDINDKM
jgi:hypothetical protein